MLANNSEKLISIFADLAPIVTLWWAGQHTFYTSFSVKLRTEYIPN